MIRFKALIIFCTLIAAGCGASLEKYPKEKCAVRPQERLTKAIHDNCLRCHTRDFATADDICARKSMIIDSVKQGRMPKLGKLSEADRAIILAWK